MAGGGGARSGGSFPLHAPPSPPPPAPRAAAKMASALEQFVNSVRQLSAQGDRGGGAAGGPGRRRGAGGGLRGERRPVEPAGPRAAEGRAGACPLSRLSLRRESRGGLLAPAGPLPGRNSGLPRRTQGRARRGLTAAGLTGREGPAVPVAVPLASSPRAAAGQCLSSRVRGMKPAPAVLPKSEP